MYLMGPSIRRLLIVAVLLSPGYLALPATAGTEPETAICLDGRARSRARCGRSHRRRRIGLPPSALGLPPMPPLTPGCRSLGRVLHDAGSAGGEDGAGPPGRLVRGVAEPLQAGGDSGGQLPDPAERHRSALPRSVPDRLPPGGGGAVADSIGRFLPMILEVFRQKGLPEELVFTAMIESGFDPVAVSRAGAKGLWQFMAPDRPTVRPAGGSVARRAARSGEVDGGGGQLPEGPLHDLRLLGPGAGRVQRGRDEGHPGHQGYRDPRLLEPDQQPATPRRDQELRARHPRGHHHQPGARASTDSR